MKGQVVILKTWKTVNKETEKRIFCPERKHSGSNLNLVWSRCFIQKATSCSSSGGGRPSSSTPLILILNFTMKKYLWVSMKIFMTNFDNYLDIYLFPYFSVFAVFTFKTEVFSNGLWIHGPGGMNVPPNTGSLVPIGTRDPVLGGTWSLRVFL